MSDFTDSVKFSGALVDSLCGEHVTWQAATLPVGIRNEHGPGTPAAKSSGKTSVAAHLTLTLVLVGFTLMADPAPVGFALLRSPRELPTVTKKDIVKTISEQIGMTQVKTKAIVEKMFDAIVDTLVQEGRIELRNFGVFEVRRREARRARNPRTGAVVSVPEKWVVTFKPGKEMEVRVRQLAAQRSTQTQTQSTAASESNEPAAFRETTLPGSRPASGNDVRQPDQSPRFGETAGSDDET